MPDVFVVLEKDHRKVQGLLAEIEGASLSSQQRGNHEWPARGRG